MNVMEEQSSQRKKRLYDSFNRLRRMDYRKCLFSDECTQEVINAHSVSYAVLQNIQEGGHVITPDIRYSNDRDGMPRPQITFVPVGISKDASTGTFVCHDHDDVFKPIDNVPMDVEDPYIRDLLLYRAVLREIWLLLAKYEDFVRIHDQMPFPTTPSHLPRIRLESLMYLRGCLSQSLGIGDSIGETIPVEHLPGESKATDQS